MKYKKPFILLGLFLLIFSSCNTGGKNDHEGDPDSLKAETPVPGDWVRIWLPSEPDNLNPITHVSATGTYVMEPMFVTLIQYHPLTFEPEPFLAVSMPTKSADGLSFTYEITPEAVWDDGSAVTGYDLQMSLKAMNNPLVEPPVRRLYFNFISDVVVDSTNPRKFTVVTDKPFFQAEPAIGGIDFVPVHIYDPKGLMAGFRISDLRDHPEKYRNDPRIKQFAEEFMSDFHARDPKGIGGAGAYAVEEWVTNDHVTLKRKENWWGDKLKSKNWAYNVYPAKLIYKFIPDRKAAIAALKAGELDVMNGIAEKDFEEMRKAPTSDFNFYTPDVYAFTYFALNTRPIPGRKNILTDVNVRKALAYLLDIDKMIEELYYGYGKRTVGPILPIHKDDYNTSLKPIPHDPELAKKMLADAGWKDTNGNGTIDKVINGKPTEFEVDLLISEGANRGDDMIAMVSDAFAKAGIKVNGQIKPLDVCSKETHDHQFDIFGISNISGHLPPDLEQNWSTEQWEQKGSNITGFGNEESDKLLADIRAEMDPAKRHFLYLRIQEMIYNEQPAIFLRMPVERIAIQKRFRNTMVSAMRPGYKPFSFWAPLAEQKFK